MPAFLPLNLTEALQKGLRSNRKDPVNALSLESCKNSKPYPDGLRPFIPPNDPFVRDFPLADREFPFPQIFKGLKENFLLEKDGIYTFDERFDSTALATVDYVDGVTPANIIAGGQWHFIDMSETWIFFNGQSIVFKDNSTFGGVNVVRVANNVNLRTGCKFRGRLVTGGFSSDASWNKDWKDIFKDYNVNNANVPSEFDSVDFNLRDNFVVWSTIGQSDMAFRWLLYPTESQTGYTADPGYTAAKSLFNDAVQRNEFGWMPMPFRGVPLVIKELGAYQQGKGAVIVYGEGGVAALVPHSGPVPTFGLLKLSDAGVKGRGAVAGDDFEHVFLDEEDMLWKLNSNLELQELGYDEFFEEQKPFTMNVKRTRREREYYICNEEKGFTLTQNGLSEQSTLLGSHVVLNGQPIGTFISNGDDIQEWKSGRIDMRLSGRKLVHQIFVSCDDWENMRAAVEYQYEPNNVFLRSDWIPLNDNGAVTFNIEAKTFKIVLQKLNNPTSINFCEVRWSSSDKTNVRGPNVSAGE